MAAMLLQDGVQIEQSYCVTCVPRVDNLSLPDLLRQLSGAKYKTKVALMSTAQHHKSLMPMPTKVMSRRDSTRRHFASSSLFTRKSGERKSLSCVEQRPHSLMTAFTMSSHCTVFTGNNLAQRCCDGALAFSKTSSAVLSSAARRLTRRAPTPEYCGTPDRTLRSDLFLISPTARTSLERAFAPPSPLLQSVLTKSMPL